MRIATLVSLLAIVAPLNVAHAQRAEDIYRVGTDVGAAYLAQHMGMLRVTLLLQECRFNELANGVGHRLPDTQEHFLSVHGQKSWSESAISDAAQVSRAYVLGYEVGVRTEFHREMSPERVRSTCALAAAAAGQFLHEEVQ